MSHNGNPVLSQPVTGSIADYKWHRGAPTCMPPSFHAYSRNHRHTTSHGSEIETKVQHQQTRRNETTKTMMTQTLSPLSFKVDNFTFPI